MNILRLALVTLFLFPAHAVAGEISGRITVSRRITKNRLVTAGYQPRGPVIDGPSIRASSSEYQHIVVFLEGEGLERAKPVNERIRQKNRAFTPELVVIPVGSTLSFPNDDSIFHNIYSLSNAKSFDLGYYPQNESRSITVAKPGVIQIYCHLHKEMSAAILVAPNRWYTKVPENGQFRFSNVPPGEYRLVVWHKSAGFFRRNITVPESGEVQAVMDVPTGGEPAGTVPNAK